MVWGEASRSFDGSNDEISAGDVLNVTTGNVSICAWTKLTEDASADFVIGKDSGEAGVPGYHLVQTTSDLLNFNVSDDGVDVTAASVTDTDEAWAFYCGTFDATNDILRIYTNGVNDGTNDSSGINSLTNAVNFKMGEDGGEFNDASGVIGYGKQFAAILTAVEVNEIMWYPERIVIATPNIFWPIWGDATEVDLAAALDGTPTGTSVSTDGPPVMIGNPAL